MHHAEGYTTSWQQALHTIMTASTTRTRATAIPPPFVRASQASTKDVRVKTNRAWAEGTWETRSDITRCRLRQFIHTPSNKPIGHDLARHWLVRPKRIRNGRFKPIMNHTWLSPSASCECGAANQTAQHSLSLPCFPDFRGKCGYTSLPPGGQPSSTVLYPGPPSSSPRPPTPPFSCLSRCNRAISYGVFLSFPSTGEHMPSLVVDPLSFVLHVLPTSTDSSPIFPSSVCQRMSATHLL